MNKTELKKRKILFALWNCENKTGWTNYQFSEPLKDIFKEVISFDPRKRRFQYGPERMRIELLRIIKENKPDYAFFQVGSDEINTETLEKINEISPDTKTIALFTDDDTDFPIFSRYYALFLDYCMAAQPKYVADYQKDGLENAFPMMGTNMNLFRPLKLDKKYDVSFVGQYYPPRAEIIKFLLNHGVDVKIFGNSKWLAYPEFRNAFLGGPIDVEKYIEVMNKSKITLALVQNQYGSIHISHRAFEASACKAFQIMDYAPEYFEHLKKDEIVMFKDKEDLLRKIRYYLKHETESDKIAGRAYQRIIRKYDVRKQLIKFFARIDEEKDFKRKPLPLIKKSIIELRKKDFDNGLEYVKEKISDYDYVSFSDGRCKKHKHKDYIQMYSLLKTDKDISCCDYSLYDRTIGTYMVSKPSRYFKFVKREKFERIISINQIAAKKDFLLGNFEKFREMINSGLINIIDKDNTAFVDIPLVRIERLNKANYDFIRRLEREDIEKAFQLNFLYKLYSLIYRKKIFTDSYPYKLIVFGFFGNRFILRYLRQAVFSKDYIRKIRNRAD